MISELYKNIPLSAEPEKLWQGKQYLAGCLSAFFRKK